MRRKSLVIVGVLLTLVIVAVIKTIIASTPIFTPSFLPANTDIREVLIEPPTPTITTPGKMPASVEEKTHDVTDLKIYSDLGKDMPRVLAFDPGGTLVASITNNGKVVALPNGKPKVVLSGLRQPHGIAFDGGKLYVAETNVVSRYDYDPIEMKVVNRVELFDMPSGGGHFTRTIRVFNNKLYVTVGSSCNVCEEKEAMRASMWVSDLNGENLRPFARGLRNTVFFTFDQRGRIWGNDMGRDLLGDNLPPEDLNIITEGSDYGWPYCYGDRIRDNRFMSEKSFDCNRTMAPVYQYPAHVAPLGLTFDGDNNLISVWHGSWNSSVPVGYKVVKLTLKNDKVTGVEDYVSGWLSGREVLGRPADVIYDADDNLYISDDKAGLIYVMTKKLK